MKRPVPREIRTTTTLICKGQITVPAWIVRKVGLKKSDKLDVSIQEEDSFIARRRGRAPHA